MANDITIAPGLVRIGQAIYGRARVAGRLYRKVAPLQASAALRRDGSPTADLLKWRDRWVADLRLQAERIARGELLEDEAHARVRTIAALVQAYRAAAALRRAESGKPLPITVETNIKALRCILARLRIAETASIAELSVPRMQDYIAQMVEAANTPERGRYAAMRMMAQARSMWAGWTRPYYARARLAIPQCLDRWPRPAGHAPVYNDPSDDLKARTAALIDRLRNEDVAAWRLATLCLAFGMRPNDAERALWSWFRARADGTIFLQYVPLKTAGSSARRVEQPVDAALWSAITAARDQATGDYIVAAPECCRAIRARISAAMREIGWAGSKTLYELRKLFASAVYNSVGLTWAAAYIGDAPTTTERYYAAAYRAAAPAIDALGAIRGR